MKEVAKCVYGSQSYRLDGPESDVDWKVFLCPTFNDFYANHRLDKTDLPLEYPRDDHFSPIDCRQFAKGLVKGNVNCLEYLYSTKWGYSATFGDFLAEAQQLFKDGYLVVCWDTFFASLEGMVKNSLDRYGVNRKSMSRAYYFYMFAMTLVVDNFVLAAKTWRGTNGIRQSVICDSPMHGCRRAKNLNAR